jgi:alpha-beta hydrolase superfamily lysophospholipase
MEKIIGVPAEVLDRSQGKPQVFDFAHWVCNRKELEAPSASVLINPEVPQIALIYCIHGLGLHGNSFSKFGQAMAERGYPVLLPDIRGFGANANRKGLDEFAPSDSLKDIHRSLASLKTFCPDLPVFILGESMGGALALQSAAQHGDLISGLICSVPSGSRFGGVQDGLRVARGLLSGKKQIDVAKMIVNRATSDQESRNRWESDPNARLELSPKELVRFQEFMDQNDKAAKSISQIPVLFLQGAKDGLVKPKGTAELYTSLASRDKDFLIVGMQEHLIFEDENFPAWIPGALSSWLEDKLKARGKFAPQ